MTHPHEKLGVVGLDTGFRAWNSWKRILQHLGFRNKVKVKVTAIQTVGEGGGRDQRSEDGNGDNELAKVVACCD